MGLFRKDSEPVPIGAPPEPSAAEALGIGPPSLTPEHLAGIEAAAQIEGNKAAARWDKYDEAMKARKEAREAQEDLIWKKVLARQAKPIGGKRR